MKRQGIIGRCSFPTYRIYILSGLNHVLVTFHSSPVVWPFPPLLSHSNAVCMTWQRPQFVLTVTVNHSFEGWFISCSVLENWESSVSESCDWPIELLIWYQKPEREDSFVRKLLIVWYCGVKFWEKIVCALDCRRIILVSTTSHLNLILSLKMIIPIPIDSLSLGSVFPETWNWHSFLNALIYVFSLQVNETRFQGLFLEADWVHFAA